MRKVVQELELPKNKGLAPVLELVRVVFGLPRVEEFTIKPGKAFLTRWLPDQDADIEPMDFVAPNSMLPHSVIRRCAEIQEVEQADAPAYVLTRMLGLADLDHMQPTTWCCGSMERLKLWLNTDGIKVHNSQLFGMPVLTDDGIDEEHLYLCTAWGRDGDFQDTQKSYKFTLR